MLQPTVKHGLALFSGGSYTSLVCPYAHSLVQSIASVKGVFTEFFRFFFFSYFSFPLKLPSWLQHYLKCSKAHFSLDFSMQLSNLPLVVSSAACNVSPTQYDKAPVKQYSSSMAELNGNFRINAYSLSLKLLQPIRKRQALAVIQH